MGFPSMDLNGRQGVFNSESLGISDYKHLLILIRCYHYAIGIRCSLFPEEVYHIRNNPLRKEGH